LTALTQLGCNNNSLTSLDASGLTALLFLSCHSNPLTSLDVSGLTALTVLACSNNSLTSLDVSGLTALTQLICSNNSLTSLDASGLTALTQLICSNNSLTSLRAVGVGAASYGATSYLGYGSYGYSGGLQLQNNNMSAAALDQFYADLATLPPGYSYNAIVVVGDNPGTDGDDPTIATAKGYTVYGS
jgi:Leucine-rich repeat (LRR) protein